MKLIRIFCLLVIMSFAIGALAQAQGTAPASGSTPQAQPSQQPAATLGSVLDRQVSGIEKTFVEAAEAMPEDKYNFTPASLNIPGSEFKDVRTFAQLVKHTAVANYFYWGGAAGEKPPANIKGPNGPDELKTKAEIVQFLKDSFAVGHRAAKNVTSDNALEEVPFRNNKLPRIEAVNRAVAHADDEYGQMVEYLRMNGIVPPASRGR